MSERLLDFDPLTGLKTWFSSSDENGGTWNLRYEQDASPILDANKESQAEGFDRRSEMWHAGTIPSVVVMEWLVKYGIDVFNKNHADGVARLLNSNEYRDVRAKLFRI